MELIGTLLLWASQSDMWPSTAMQVYRGEFRTGVSANSIHDCVYLYEAKLVKSWYPWLCVYEAGLVKSWYPIYDCVYMKLGWWSTGILSMTVCSYIKQGWWSPCIRHLWGWKDSLSQPGMAMPRGAKRRGIYFLLLFLFVFFFLPLYFLWGGTLPTWDAA